MLTFMLVAFFASADLSCVVTSADPYNYPPVGTVENLRIDEELGRWCEGNCVKTFPARFSYDTVTLQHVDVVEGVKTIDTVNRRTGSRVYARTGRADLQTLVFYDCEVRPFSGFPKRKF